MNFLNEESSSSLSSVSALDGVKKEVRKTLKEEITTISMPIIYSIVIILLLGKRTERTAS